VGTTFLLSGEAEDADKAKFEDYELLRMFQRTEKLGNDDKKVINALLDAFLFKREVQGMVKV
jgi:hypothetical protein